jgi:hypothetical protein
MQVELLLHDGCRSARAAYRLIQECLITLAIPTPVLVQVGDYPSPTVLIDGVDVMRPGSTLSPARACRIDVPTRERLLAALTGISPTASLSSDAKTEVSDQVSDP